ncbi:MAG: diguanylate cyclase [Candidatus Omnitrophica bacterium]|nr:diguanylate cyclase [Candidatus Omnitrophota bacterium]
MVYKKHQVAVSVSFGAVRVTPEKFASLKDLLDAADLAMLEVKRSHRGQFYLAC